MHGDDRFESPFDDLFDDLEQQAEGLALGERDAEVAEQRRAEYAEVELASRLFGSVGTRLVLGVSGLGTVTGVLRRAGDGWCLLTAESSQWVVRLSALTSVRGLAERGVAPPARPVTSRLGTGSALRRLAQTRAETVVHRVDGSLVRGPLGRVGADFVEVWGDGYVEVVPLAVVAAVRSG